MSLRLFPRLSAHFVRPAAPLRAAVRSMTTSAPRSSPTPSSLRSQAQFFSRSLRPTVHSLPAAGSSSTAGRATSWAPSSFTSTFLRRAFATGRRGGGGPFPFRRPPPRRYSEPGFFSKLRNRIDRWDPKKVLYVLIGVNVAVWGLWEYAKGTYVSGTEIKQHSLADMCAHRNASVTPQRISGWSRTLASPRPTSKPVASGL